MAPAPYRAHKKNQVVSCKPSNPFTLMVAVGRCKRAETAQPELKVLLSRTTLLQSCIGSLALGGFNGHTGMTVELKPTRCITVSGHEKWASNLTRRNTFGNTRILVTPNINLLPKLFIDREENSGSGTSKHSAPHFSCFRVTH